MRRPVAIVLATVFFLIALPHARAADGIAVETLLNGLKNPCGVAIRPGESSERYEIFVADSGAGRIIRLKNDAEEPAPIDVITGFPLSSLGDTGLSVGPMGLLFLDRRRLVVGVSDDAAATVRLFELEDEGVALPADSSKQQITGKAEQANFNHVYAIARTRANDMVRDALVVTCFDNALSGNVCTIVLRADTLTELALLNSSKAGAESSSPAAITIGDGGYIVVGWIGKLHQPHDGRLTFHHPASGAGLLELSTELNDILALAYSPRTGNLYAADAAWMEPKNGGVFRVDAANEPGASKCVSVKIAEAVRPSGLAFGPDGALYVTAFGDPDETSSAGVLLRITGDL
jgi:hypothetical protein